ncbi:MAG: hypothetical protein ACXVCR_12570 [Bdellovibrio sp.]
MKDKGLLFLLLSLILVITQQVKALEIEISLFPFENAPQTASQIPRELIKNNVNKIGDLDLENLLKNIMDPHKIIFGEMSLQGISLGGLADGDDGTLRFGAECYTHHELMIKSNNQHFHIPSERLVLINKLSPLRQTLDEAMVPATLLHEALCALYGKSRDNNYQMSASLLFLLSLESDERIRYLKNQWDFLTPFNNLSLTNNNYTFKAIERIPALSGGVTGGSGGGDPWSLNAKYWLMRYLHETEKQCRLNNSYIAPQTNLTCSIYLEKLSYFWSKVRQLDIESEFFETAFSPSYDSFYRIKNERSPNPILIVAQDFSVIAPTNNPEESKSYFKARQDLCLKNKASSYLKAFYALVQLWLKE